MLLTKIHKTNINLDLPKRCLQVHSAHQKQDVPARFLCESHSGTPMALDAHLGIGANVLRLALIRAPCRIANEAMPAKCTVTRCRAHRVLGAKADFAADTHHAHRPRAAGHLCHMSITYVPESSKPCARHEAQNQLNGSSGGALQLFMVYIFTSYLMAELCIALHCIAKAC